MDHFQNTILFSVQLGLGCYHWVLEIIDKSFVLELKKGRRQSLRYSNFYDPPQDICIYIFNIGNICSFNYLLKNIPEIRSSVIKYITLLKQYKRNLL